MDISDFINHEFHNIETNSDETRMKFFIKGGGYFEMYHEQDCCENVYLEDVVGDLEDLLNIPILQAEETTKRGDNSSYDDSETWTFYKLATKKGRVTLRWYGTSNGYYSEDIDIQRVYE